MGNHTQGLAGDSGRSAGVCDLQMYPERLLLGNPDAVRGFSGCRMHEAYPQLLEQSAQSSGCSRESLDKRCFHLLLTDCLFLSRRHGNERTTQRKIA